MIKKRVEIHYQNLPAVISLNSDVVMRIPYQPASNDDDKLFEDCVKFLDTKQQ